MNNADLFKFKRYIRIQANGCWLWTGQGTPDGYGTTIINGKRTMSHKASYEHFKGPVPTNHDLGHLCHDQAVMNGTCAGGVECGHRRCCNPDHLEPQTRSVNTLNQNHAHRAKTHCPKGHEYDEENTIHRGGRRFCRACDRLRKRSNN